MKREFGRQQGQRNSFYSPGDIFLPPSRKSPAQRRGSEVRMKPMSFLLFVFITVTGSVLAQQQAPEIQFQSIPDPLKLPSNLYLGEVAGVALNSKGHIFVLSRGSTTGPAYGAAAAQLLEFDAHGAFLREIGHNLYAWSYAHAVKVDKDDNIWVADKGSDMVIK